MWESLHRLVKDKPGMNIDQFGSLKYWYFDALDKSFFDKLIKRLRNPDMPIPEMKN